MKYMGSKIQGWMHDCELQFLYNEILKLQKESVIVEIGCWRGKSSHAIASAIKDSKINHKFYCVDTFKGTSTSESQYDQAKTEDILEIFKKNMIQYNVNIIVGDSAKSAEKFEVSSIDFLFLDANHDYDFVYNDVISWFSKVKTGGIICGHDYRDGYKGVKKCVDELFCNYELFPTSIWKVITSHPL